MKFCETNPDGMLKQYLSFKDIQGNTGLSYLESKGYYYTTNPKEADFYLSTCGKLLPHFVLQRTIVVMTEPASRYQKRYEERYRKLFGGFIGIGWVNTITEEEFYLGPQDFSSIQEIKEKPEYMLGMVHQKYKKEYRNLKGDREREKAVEFFDRMLEDNFHTYGRVWRKTLPWTNVGWKGTIKGSLMGDEKLVTIRNYKFLLCFENSRDDGYVSEKIFSGLLAGAIPIYFGAGDVDRYIPKNCYIEFDGEDYDALYRRMVEMTEAEFQQMRTDAREFLLSPACEPFTSMTFAKKLEAHFIQVKEFANNPFAPSELLRRIKFLSLKYIEGY